MKKPRRIVNYKSSSTSATLFKQAQILRWARVADEGFSVSEMAILIGMSRQLCLYHVKKLAALGRIVMVLEPCDSNSGLQFRVWDHLQLVTNFIPKISEAA